MSNDLYASEPTEREVNQVEGMTPLVVTQSGPVKAQVMPAESWGARTYELTATDATKVLKPDARRKRATIIVLTQAVWFSPYQSGARQSSAQAFRLPVGVPWEATHIGETWAIADSATAVVSIAEEYWTE